MAFIGSDGYDTQIKHLKSQIGSKDHELTSLRNEQRKAAEELLQAKKLREEAEYKAQVEADRATKAEKLLETKTKDVAQLRLQRDNLDSTVQALNDKVKTAEKENSRLQYHADFAAGGSNAVDQKALDDRKKLESKVKALEQELRRSEDEVHALRSGKLNSGKSNQFLDPSSPRGKQGGNRRRSTSLSSSTRIQDLEAEIESLRSSGSSSLDLDKLKTQLNNAKRELDKLTNANLALEKSSKREIDDLKSRLEDANFELEDRRRDGGGGGSSKELETAKKEVITLKGQVQRLEQELSVRTSAVESLEKKTEELDSLQTALAEERARREDLERAAAIPLPTSPNPDLLEKINHLESQLSEARSQTSISASSNTSLPAAAQIRRLERELEKIRRELATAEDEIEKLDIENLALKANKALPGSPSSKSIVLPVVDYARIAEHEETIVQLQSRLAEGEAGAEELKGLRLMLRDTEGELEMARNEIEKERSRSAKLDATVQDFDVERLEFEKGLEQLRTEITTGQERITALQCEVQQAQSRLSESDDTTLNLSAQLAESRTSLQAITRSLEEAEQQCSDLRSELSARQGETTDVASLRQAVTEHEGLTRQLREQLEAITTAKAELEVKEFGHRQERDMARVDLTRLKTELESLEGSMKAAEEQHAAEAAGFSEIIRNETEAKRLAQAEVDVLKMQLLDAEKNLANIGTVVDDLQDKLQGAIAEKLKVEDELHQAQEDIGNRSTESEARARDEELFQMKEELAIMRLNLDTAKTEMEGTLFVRDKDIEEARSTISRLKTAISDVENASRKAESRHVNLLHDKIGRLRSERDELRVSLNFIQHEHRFARQALESDKSVAVMELLDVKKVVREKTESLEKALADLTKIVQLEDELRDAITARDELVMQQNIHQETIRTNQTQLRENAVELGTMASHLAHSTHAASKAQTENVQLARFVRELESKVDRLMEDRQTLSALESDLGNRPGSRAASIRTGSAMGHYSTSAADNAALRDQVADLQEKITRRDAEISRDKNELRRLKTTTRLAEDASRENQSDLEVANHRIIQLEVQLAAARRGAEQANNDVQNLSASVSRLDEEVRTTRIERDVSSKGNVEVVRGLVIGLAMQKKGLKEVRQKWRVAEAGLEGSRGTVAMLESQLGESKESLIKANGDAESSAKRLLDVEGRLAETCASITRLEAELADMESRLSVSEIERQQVADTATSTQDALNAQVSELQTSRQVALERVSALEAETSDLLNKLGSSEKARTDSVGSAEIEIASHVAKIANFELALAQAEEAKVKAVAEVAALVESLGDADQAHADEMAVGEQREAEAALRAESLARDLEARILEVDSLRSRVEVVQAELDGVVRELAIKDQVIKDRDASIGTLESLMADTQAKLDTSLQTASTLESQIAESEEARSLLNSEIIQLKIANEARIRAVEDMKAEVEIAERRNGDALQLSKKVEKLEEQVRAGTELLRQKEVDLKSRSASLIAAESELIIARSEINSGHKDLREQGMEVARLQAEIADLRLATATRPEAEAVDEASLAKVTALQQEIADLTEHVQGLEDTLTKKVAEVDEAEDRVREAFKDISRLRKKNDKLERQKATAETAANTAINKTLAPPSSANTSTATATAPRVAASPRPPLRQVNVFEPQTQTQSVAPRSVGVKRLREMDEDSGEKLPAECILLPPSAPTSVKKAGRGFIPSRGAYNGGITGTGRENTFALPSTPSVRNIFATD